MAEIRKKCEKCGTPFVAKRMTARFCDAKCHPSYNAKAKRNGGEGKRAGKSKKPALDIADWLRMGEELVGVELISGLRDGIRRRLETERASLDQRKADLDFQLQMLAGKHALLPPASS